jgi:hypothetical protein
MRSNENPYASPGAEIENVVSNRQLALRRLFLPALGILITGTLATSYWLYETVRPMWTYEEGKEVAPERLKEFWAYFFNVETLMIIGTFLSICGAIQMLKGRSYSVCVMGATMSMIPLISPGYVLAIPFGIWALVILLRKDTRAAFAEIN